MSSSSSFLLLGVLCGAACGSREAADSGRDGGSGDAGSKDAGDAPADSSTPGERAREAAAALPDAGPRPPCRGLFSAPVPYGGTRADPATGMTLADFNDDRRLELASVVITDPESADFATSVVLFAGLGNGYLGPQDPVLPETVNWLGSADLDRDGKMDLLAAQGSDIDVLMGAGDLTFGAPTPYPAGSPAYGGVVADFNGDGALDVVVSVGVFQQPSTQHLSAFLGGGNGTLMARVDSDVGWAGSMVALDVDHDGRVDLVSVDADSEVSVFLGNGIGAFRSPERTPSSGSYAQNLSVADLDGDGWADAVVTGGWGHVYASAVCVMLAQGATGFASPVCYDEVAGGPMLGQTVIADFDGDGRADVAVAVGSGENGVHVLLGNGDGTLQPPVFYEAGPMPGTAIGPVVLLGGDVDGDGKLDLVVGSDGAQGSVLLGCGP